MEVATPEEWKVVTEWGNGEHWNIGFRDPECFFAIDPGGFFLGKAGGRPVSAVSLVNYDDSYAVWGHYLVAPGERGKGYGIGVCKVASRHSGNRTTAGDAMPEQVQNYSKDGSQPIHKTVHWYGDLARTGSQHEQVVPITAAHLDAVADYDAESFPARRGPFLEKWLFAEGHRALVYLSDDGVAGYGVIRPAPVGHRIGPLTADTPEIAHALLESLTAELPAGETMSVFAPDLQPATAGLLTDLGLAEHFHVVRMWRGPRPDLRTERVYAISSLEVG
ncbi:GNAT family N-acetyltransferase [Phytoactinopolyspora sp. XMNu-373]|uniref:GNAT family N-acetyltransferase n=1 Tax=Phytoactinopolyspora mesophila TaxID=2650750 RepID=A0A7K3LXV0_9ACTN|nr:GNAT family N-acetyltransferase [Phytoactinopolyspora mesophila]